MQKCVPGPLRRMARDLLNGKVVRRGLSFVDKWSAAPATPTPKQPPARNPLEQFFDARKDGHGVWKWRHYFDLYHRHLAKFVGNEVGLVEIGVYSGGSLEMWRHYFGPRCRVYGVDIEPACKSYENDNVQIFIGDQADRGFWKRFRTEVPGFDVVIDDGGHQPEQQIVTLEETLPYLRPGGVFICEDVHGVGNEFAHYVAGLSQQLNAADDASWDLEDNERRLCAPATPFQSAIHSIHLYPYAVVIETSPAPVKELVAPKHGTVWQPFLT
jgi:hypothetical protein